MQFQVSRIAGAMAPSLVVLPSPAGDSPNTQVDGDTQILGLTLAQRAVMAARRAGYLQVVFLKRDGAAEPGATTVRDWNALAETLGSDPATVVIVPATILSEAKWLKRTA